MSLELIKDSIRVNQVIGEDSSQTVIENDIIVPDVKPDIGRVLIMDGDVFVNSADTMQDKILVNGTLAYKILYVSDDESQSVKSINTNAGFSYALEVPSARQGMKSKVKCEVEHIDYNVLNGRKVNVKAILKMSGRVMDEIAKDVVNDLSGIDNIQTLKERAEVNCFIGGSEVNHVVNERLEVPAGKPTIKEILRNDVKIVGKDYKITDDKIIAKAEVNISTLYIADDEDRSIQFMEHEIPFTQFIDLADVNDNCSCEVDFRIVSSEFTAEEDSDGELRIINGEMNIDIAASGYEKRSIKVVEDAYSPLMRMNLEKEAFRIKEVVAENKSQIVLKDTIVVEDGDPEISEVFNVICKPALSEVRVMDDKIFLEGVVNNNVLYVANNLEQPIHCCQQEVPFRQNIDIKEITSEMDCDVDIDIEHCNYSMVSANEVEVRLVINVASRVSKETVLPLIVKVSELPSEDRSAASQPSLTIYFSQPGDTLWKVAKKYYTTMDDIKRINGLTDAESFNPGQKLIIPRRNS